MWVRLVLLAVVMVLSSRVQALELALPGSASLSREDLSDPDSYLLPTGPFADGTLPTIEVEGRVLQQAWRVEAQGMDRFWGRGWGWWIRHAESEIRMHDEKPMFFPIPLFQLICQENCPMRL